MCSHVNESDELNLVVHFLLVAAARALMDFPDLSAEEVAEKAMGIASDMCVYTNKEFMVEAMDTKEEEEDNE